MEIGRVGAEMIFLIMCHPSHCSCAARPTLRRPKPHFNTCVSSDQRGGERAERLHTAAKTKQQRCTNVTSPSFCCSLTRSKASINSLILCYHLVCTAFHDGGARGWGIRCHRRRPENNTIKKTYCKIRFEHHTRSHRVLRPVWVNKGLKHQHRFHLLV